MSTESKPDRKLRADAERNRTRILEAADRVFAERGLSATMDDVAEAAGVGVGTVYRRFPEKADLIDAIFAARTDGLAAFAEQGLEMDDPWEGLKSFVERAAAMHAGDRALRQLIFESGQGRGFVDRALTRIRPAVAGFVARAKASGDLREDFEVFDMPLIQMAIVSLNDYIGEAAPDAWRRVLAVVLDGMRASRSDTTPLSAPAMEPGQLQRAVAKPPRRG